MAAGSLIQCVACLVCTRAQTGSKVFHGIDMDRSKALVASASSDPYVRVWDAREKGDTPTHPTPEETPLYRNAALNFSLLRGSCGEDDAGTPWWLGASGAVVT